MLYRFREAQNADLGIIDSGRSTRPKGRRAIAEITSLATCERFRGQVLREISRATTEIYNPAHPDSKIRDLNDQLNQLFYEKFVWEQRIRELNGGTYKGEVLDPVYGRRKKGDPHPYKYYGRAKELPGVKELFQEATRPRDEKLLEKRQDLRKQVDAAYYGYNLDEEDGTLLDYEFLKEKEAAENLLQQGGDVPDGWEPLPGDKGDGLAWRLPTPAEVQEELVERRRRRLLDKLS